MSQSETMECACGLNLRKYFGTVAAGSPCLMREAEMFTPEYIRYCHDLEDSDDPVAASEKADAEGDLVFRWRLITCPLCHARHEGTYRGDRGADSLILHDLCPVQWSNVNQEPPKNAEPLVWTAVSLHAVTLQARGVYITRRVESVPVVVGQRGGVR